MSKRNSYSPGKAAKAALGTNGFAPHIPELLESQAWRSRSIHLVRLLDRLEMEHIAHAGKENGYLVVTWDQLVEYGIGRRFIKSAIVEGAHLGLIEVTHKGFPRRDPSNYRITYLPAKFVPAVGAPEYHEPTHEWRKYVDKTKALNGRRNAALSSPQKSFLRFTMGDHTSAPRVNYHQCTTGEPIKADSEGFRLVTHGELLSTLRSTTPHAVFPPGAELPSPGASPSRLERPPPARAGLRSNVPARGRPPMTDELEQSSTTEDSNHDVRARKPAGEKKRARGDWQLQVALQRDAEAQRYIEANMDRYGLEGVLERWHNYEAGIVAKYQGPDADCSDADILNAAWRARDRAHR